MSARVGAQVGACMGGGCTGALAAAGTAVWVRGALALAQRVCARCAGRVSGQTKPSTDARAGAQLPLAGTARPRRSGRQRGRGGAAGPARGAVLCPPRLGSAQLGWARGAGGGTCGRAVRSRAERSGAGGAAARM